MPWRVLPVLLTPSLRHPRVCSLALRVSAFRFHVGERSYGACPRLASRRMRPPGHPCCRCRQDVPLRMAELTLRVSGVYRTFSTFIRQLKDIQVTAPFSLLRRILQWAWPRKHLFETPFQFFWTHPWMLDHTVVLFLILLDQ